MECTIVLNRPQQTEQVLFRYAIHLLSSHAKNEEYARLNLITPILHLPLRGRQVYAIVFIRHIEIIVYNLN